MSVGEGSRDEGISLCVKFQTSRMLFSAIFWWGLFLFLLLFLWQGENKVNSYSDQLKLGQVCKFGVEFDKNFASRWEANQMKITKQNIHNHLSLCTSFICLVKLFLCLVTKSHSLQEIVFCEPEWRILLPSSTSTQLNSTQFKSIEVEIALIPISPATHPKKYISQLLVAQFGPNFKERFLGPFLTDANRHTDIYPSNICPRNICPYKEYLSWYWPDFDQTLKEGSWEHLSQIPTFTVTLVQATIVLGTLVHIRNISAVTDQIFSPNFLQPLIFLDPKICGHTIFWIQIFWIKIF